jgi:hypothetical protein
MAREGRDPWRINFQRQDKEWKILVDRGANGGITGRELRVIGTELDQGTIDMCGIDNHQVKGLKIVSVGGEVKSTFGEIIIILHQQERIPDGKTILSCLQMEHFKTIVMEESPMVTKVYIHTSKQMKNTKYQ